MTKPYIAAQLERIVDMALMEDIGAGDTTTRALIATDAEGTATIVMREDGIIAGLEIAQSTFERVDHSLKWNNRVADGDIVNQGDTIATVSGSLGAILMAERVALNFMQRMSGIASTTAQYVEAVADTNAVITDTRKTVPGLRILDRYAVWLGGGKNHRYNLTDGVLIKDNHIAFLRQRGLKLATIIARVRDRAPHTMKIEIEVDSVEMALEASQGGADVIMLDNMDIRSIREVMDLLGTRNCLIEASGRMDLDKARAAAEAGVDIISVGALTHSVRARDIALQIQE